MKKRLVVAITGGSGAIYAVRLIEVLLAAGCDVFLSISPAGRLVLEQELDLTIDLDNFQKSHLLLDSEGSSDSKLDLLRTRAGITTEDSSVLSFGSGDQGSIEYQHHTDLMSPIASGSFLTQGMIVCPCSGSTLGAIAHAMGTNLIHRAAEVHLKERRKLIVVPRESPLSLPQINNFKTLAEAGAVIMPASPGFYHGVTSIRDLVDFIVGRVCDQIGIEHSLIRRWGE